MTMLESKLAEIKGKACRIGLAMLNASSWYTAHGETMTAEDAERITAEGKRVMGEFAYAYNCLLPKQEEHEARELLVSYRAFYKMLQGDVELVEKMVVKDCQPT